MDRWENQEEAYQFAMSHPSCMLNMDMGTGKTRVAIDVLMDRPDVYTVLVVCPKKVIPVWRINFEKFYPGDARWDIWDVEVGTVAKRCESLNVKLLSRNAQKTIIVLNYDIVWRKPLSELLSRASIDMIILDESHRAKSPGSKVSRFLALLGKKARYKLCLSGTPMSHSTLDIYGQYRFLDPNIFGTRYSAFLGSYAVMSMTNPPFVIGLKNQQDLMDKFNSIAYTCKMDDISDRLKLPPKLPPNVIKVQLSAKDMALSKQLSKQFFAEYEDGKSIALNNVLEKMLRLQQITSGFTMLTNEDDPLSVPMLTEINTVKRDGFADWIEDVSPVASVVVFCVFTHDIDVCVEVAKKAKRDVFQLTGKCNQLKEWQEYGGILVVQIQAGAEGVDMTRANTCLYYSRPLSLAQYEQSKARLYRPGQTKPVAFHHLIAEGTIDEVIYETLNKRIDLLSGIQQGKIDFGYLK